jgi:hypothetical protein
MALMLSVREIFTRTIDSEPTEYRGIHMRSKLEAAFARHLDRLGVDWTYEPELFGRRGEGYLPDFRLIDARGGSCYVELKPTIEQAEAAQMRMEIIWQSHPEAVLLAVSAEESRWYACVRGGGWTSWQEAWAHR